MTWAKALENHYLRVAGTWNDRHVLRNKIENSWRSAGGWERYYRKAVKHENGVGKDILCAYLTGKTTEQRAPGDDCEKEL